MVEQSVLDQFYTLHRMFGGSWEFAQPVHICLVDMEKAFVPDLIFMHRISILDGGKPCRRALALKNRIAMQWH